MEDRSGRVVIFGQEGRSLFQTDMMHAPCIDCPRSGLWFFGQFFPCTMGCTQYMLRKKVLGGDMTKYRCFQGYASICCIKAGACQEESCPEFCLCLEACLCTCAAVSGSRNYTMGMYNLASESCDYRLIRINNCIQLLACCCDIMGMYDENIRGFAAIVDFVASLVYHTISGCMTAQVAYQMDYYDRRHSGQGRGKSVAIPPVALPPASELKVREME